ncbi:MAG: hypothetical protein EPN82_02545 [Bacteroidetes bacterium]|nr:MAG: hypothetical protein EPN82_02545 [Bacteroidota bacterium]
MWHKKNSDGTWIDKVNQLEQSAEVNLHDMVIGFFSGNLLNKENLRQVIMDVIEFANNHRDTFCYEREENKNEIPQEKAKDDNATIVSLSSCYVYQRVAETIVEELGDFEFARQVYKQSEELAVDIEDYSGLADSILLHLKDEDWYNNLMTKAYSMVSNCADVLAIESEFSDN